jgi:hypothetical protein
MGATNPSRSQDDMLDRNEVDAMAAKNPGVNRDRLNSGLDALEALDAAGMKSEQGYRIVSPFTRRPPPSDSKREKSRAPKVRPKRR